MSIEAIETRSMLNECLAMSGIEALGRLKRSENTRAIPAIALSADATKGTIEHALAAGFQDYLTKPVNIDELRQAIRKAIKGFGTPSAETNL